jgi:hypothetical protein
MYGKGMVTSSAMNQHKEMAGAGQKGNFGVESFESAAVRKGRAITGGGEGRSDGYRREAKA